MPKLFKEFNDGKLDITLSESDVLTIMLNSSLNINYSLKDGDYKILIFNNSNNDIEIIENGDIINSNVEIYYLELNNYHLKHNNTINVHSNSSLKINGIYLGANDKNIEFKLINKDRDSLVDISNNVVCLENSVFSLNVIGKILKGAKNSKCFQKNRCLTFENPKYSKILPVLEIDENDVEASHSLSSGTIDEDVLFYMNSRGLNKKDALSLLLVSYLMPNKEFFEQFFNGSEIMEIAYKKVEKICSI